jgi:RHS repeat-associated protein
VRSAAEDSAHRHGLTPSNPFNRVNPGNSFSRDPDRVRNPYNHWLFSKTDERYQTTTYTRDERRRVTRIDHPDGSYETFAYNWFNQVYAHRLASGATRIYLYDGGVWPPPRGRLTHEYNDVDGIANATIYTYDALDRVETISHPWSRAKGALFSVKMTYNGRHQVVTEEYPATDGGSNPTKEYSYDANGNCNGIKTELGYWSTYTYDDYRRCTSYIEPLNAPDWNGTGTQASRRWDWIYDRWVNGIYYGASSHTSKEWRVQVEPAFNAAGERHATGRVHDLNNRLIEEETGWVQRPYPAALGDWYPGAEREGHSFTYDENGQKNRYTDPQGRVTTYDYDLRNRLWKTNETVNTVPRTTETLYDPIGNKTLVKFPDNQTQQWLDYDGFGQAWRFIDERNNTTNLSYIWGPMKKLYTVTTHRDRDAGGTEDQLTTFVSDDIGRPQNTVFPDGTNEYTIYVDGQAHDFKTRKNQWKHIYYDARGREVYHTWDGDAAPRIDRVWDNASRMTRISNLFSTIDYAYDAAGQIASETNNIPGSGGPVTTNYFRYGSGEVAHVVFPFGGARIRKDYNARGKLNTAGVADGAGNWQFQLINYHYRADGKVDHQDYGNGTTTTFGYDGRGFISSVSNTRPNATLSTRDYFRDNRDRVYAWESGSDNSVNPMQDGRGHRFAYDAEGQLTDAWYGPYDPANSTDGTVREDHFNYDALGNRRSWNHVGWRSWLYFARRDNGLNQYVSWSPSTIYYDDNYPGYGFPGNGNLMAEGWITASYNALNQPVAIWSPNMPSGAFTWFGYDPLGRCVKRWVGPSGGETSNPATYMYYDGWNLIQEGNSASAVTRLYVHGNRIDEIPVTFNVSTSEYGFHHYDARGDCTLLTDIGGNIREQYYYDAFGKPYIYNASGGTYYGDVSPFGNRFLFTGREWLQDLKLYDYRHRLYQPELGRFLQPDPKQFEAGDYNLYRYCHNDPVNRSDPMGLFDRSNDDPEKAKPVLVKDTYRPVLGSHIPAHVRVFSSGNWNDRTVANHASSNLYKETGKGGLTLPSGSSNVSGNNVDLTLHVDWYYDKGFAGTNVITRELQHVQDARNLAVRYWTGAAAASLDHLRNFSGIVSGFNIQQKFRYDQSSGTHNLEKYPAVPTSVPEQDPTRWQ